jgi:hypothetical protein
MTTSHIVAMMFSRTERQIRYPANWRLANVFLGAKLGRRPDDSAVSTYTLQRRMTDSALRERGVSDECPGLAASHLIGDGPRKTRSHSAEEGHSENGVRQGLGISA